MRVRFKSPAHPHFPSESTLIRNRASYRKQSSCLMTSSLNPLEWEGGGGGWPQLVDSLGVSRHPNKTRGKHPVPTPVSRRTTGRVGWGWASFPCCEADWKLSSLYLFNRHKRAKIIYICFHWHELVFFMYVSYILQVLFRVVCILPPLIAQNLPSVLVAAVPF